MRYTPAAVLLAVSLAGGISAANVSAESAAHSVITPGELSWAAVPSLPPGAQLATLQGPLDQARPFIIRLKLPANYRIPPHWHPAIEHVTVLSGTFNLGMGETFDETRTRALGPGTVAIMQPKTPHFGWTRDATEVQVHGVGPWGVNYVNPADDPRKK